MYLVLRSDNSLIKWLFSGTIVFYLLDYVPYMKKQLPRNIGSRCPNVLIVIVVHGSLFQVGFFWCFYACLFCLVFLFLCCVHWERVAKEYVALHFFLSIYRLYYELNMKNENKHERQHPFSFWFPGRKVRLGRWCFFVLLNWMIRCK